MTVKQTIVVMKKTTNDREKLAAMALLLMAKNTKSLFNLTKVV